jgi:hypothetical protein
MLSRAIVVLALLAFATGLAPAQPASDAAQAMVGAWEISNADRDRSCAVTFSVDSAPGGLKLELDAACATALPLLGDVVAWKIGPNDVVLLLDAKGATVVEFTEVESGLYESDRRVGGLMFLQTQAAIKAQTRTADQLFGDWQFLRELDKPLCKLTLSSDGAGGDSYRLVVKPGCEAGIAGLGFTTWRLDRDQIVLVGPGATWRFAESDPTTWERFPLTEDPLLLVRP